MSLKIERHQDFFLPLHLSISHCLNDVLIYFHVTEIAGGLADLTGLHNQILIIASLLLQLSRPKYPHQQRNHRPFPESTRLPLHKILNVLALDQQLDQHIITTKFTVSAVG